MFGILLFNAAAVVGVLQSILWAGLIWMPFAAATCAFVARRKGLDIKVYGIAGAAYSVLFVIPWIYLVLRMHSISVSRRIVHSMYVAMYVYVWMLGLMVLNVIIAFDSDWRGVGLLLLLLNVITWIVSADMIQRRNRYDREQEALIVSRHSVEYVNEMRRTSLPHFVYIIPFAMVLAWMVVLMVVFYFI